MQKIKGVPTSFLAYFLYVVFFCGCQHMSAVRPCEPSGNITYANTNEHILLKPRLKYELMLSLHVLETAEDHHKLFIPWAEDMRKNLSGKTLKDAKFLINSFHEWKLCSWVSDYDGPDTIECITEYIENENVTAINKDAQWLRTNPRFWFNPNFAAWLADFLRRYYSEGFEEGWISEHRQLVYNDAKAISEELDSLTISITDFMEQHTGRQFSEDTQIIFYPSSFSRPQHAYGFNENGKKVTVYKVNGGLNGLVGSGFHELMHGLIHGWDNHERMKEPIVKLGQNPVFKASRSNSYSYPNGWIEEIIVHSVSNYLTCKAGFANPDYLNRTNYGYYEAAFYDAIFDKYDQFEKIDDFIFYAMTHIHATNDPQKPFIYIKNSDQ